MSKDQYFITDVELKELATEYGVQENEICRVCGKLIMVQIYKNAGVCSDRHRKIRDGDDKSPYPFVGDSRTGAP